MPQATSSSLKFADSSRIQGDGLASQSLDKDLHWTGCSSTAVPGVPALPVAFRNWVVRFNRNLNKKGTHSWHRFAWKYMERIWEPGHISKTRYETFIHVKLLGRVGDLHCSVALAPIRA